MLPFSALSHCQCARNTQRIWIFWGGHQANQTSHTDTTPAPTRLGSSRPPAASYDSYTSRKKAQPRNAVIAEQNSQAYVNPSHVSPSEALHLEQPHKESCGLLMLIRLLHRFQPSDPVNTPQPLTPRSPCEDRTAARDAGTACGTELCERS